MTFRGERPADTKMYILYLDAVREAVTNAIRHGQAENVYVDGEMIETASDNDDMSIEKISQNSEDNTIITEKKNRKVKKRLMVGITNDGVKPTEPIVEGIGLGKLREKLVRAGIRMEMLWEDGAQMKLYF